MSRRLLVICLVAGCARGGAGITPISAVHGYLAAKDDPHVAYRLLSEKLRRSISEPDFAARWRQTAEERKSQVAALGPLGTKPATERARATWSDGREAALVFDPTGWRMAAPRIATSGAASPEEAVRRFAEAFEHHDLDGLLDLMADPLRSLVERELADRIGRLKTAVHKEIQVDGPHARLRFDDRFYLDLRLENGLWRVSDFN